MFSLTSCSLFIDTLRGDLGVLFDEKSQTIFCYLRGMFVLAFFSTIFGAFCLHGFFRLCRIVYSKYQILQKYFFQLILIIFQWISSLIFARFVQITYLPSEFYCSIPFDSLRPILSASLLAYGIPSSLLAVIYFRLVFYVRNHNQLVQNQNGNRRDASVIRRTVIIVVLLWLLGVPSSILVCYGQINGGILHPLTYRIEWITPSFALLFLSIILVKSDPKLNQVICRTSKSKKNLQSETMLPSNN